MILVFVIAVDAAFEEEDIAAPAPDAKQTAETDLHVQRLSYFAKAL
jgi:hypothetical protein